MALKTEQEIERDFYSMVKSSSLGAAIRGRVYRSEMRPNGSNAEDIVVRLISGTDGQIQRGIIIVNVFVPDIPYLSDGRLVPDYDRIAELQVLMKEFLGSQAASEYKIETDGTPRTEAAADIEQHFICTRIHYKRISD